MNCREAGRLLNAYVDAELDLTATLAVEDHLHDCPRCRARESGLRQLHSTMRRHADFRIAPGTLRGRLVACYGERRPPSSQSTGWRLAALTSTVAALTLAAVIGFSTLTGKSDGAGSGQAKVVYHIAHSDMARAALRNLANHLESSPGVKVVVVAHNSGVDFLLRGARDDDGEPYDTAIRKFVARGVEFRVCGNTLVRRNMGAESILPDAKLVPSGIAEISRLQNEESYAYMKL